MSERQQYCINMSSRAQSINELIPASFCLSLSKAIRRKFKQYLKYIAF